MRIIGFVNTGNVANSISFKALPIPVCLAFARWLFGRASLLERTIHRTLVQTIRGTFPLATGRGSRVCRAEADTLARHARLQTLAEAAVLAPVSVEQQDDTVAVLQTLVAHLLLDAAAEEALAAFARGHAVVVAARAVPAYLAQACRSVARTCGEYFAGQRWVIAIQTKIQLPNTLPIGFKLCDWNCQMK